LFIENVKNLLSVNGGWDFARILIELDRGGTMQSGRLSILKTTCHKTEKEFILSDILETEVPQKYFLSEKAKTRLRFYKLQNMT
jgi:DNA (cytosine-5)-methyltransferase 1